MPAIKKRPPRATRKDYAINAAIHELAREADHTNKSLAELLYISMPTVSSWFRRRPSKAPKMALALLRYKLDLPGHKLPKLLDVPEPKSKRGKSAR